MTTRMMMTAPWMPGSSGVVIAIFAIIGVLILAIVAIAIGALSGVFKSPHSPCPTPRWCSCHPSSKGAAGI